MADDRRSGPASRALRLAYVTAQAPWGRSEQFILAEIRAVAARGHNVLVAPLRPRLGDAFADGADLRPRALAAPFFAPRYVGDLAFWALRRPDTVAALLATLVCRSGGPARTVKNLAVLPKAAHVARGLVRRRIEHVHAHWASTPSTMAFAAARLADVPWSLTAHRWDIAARNLLPAKAASAAFVRVISDDGRAELVGYLPAALAATAKIFTLHMGVDLPRQRSAPRDLGARPSRIVVPARLVEKKGHRYLLDALAILRREGGDAPPCLVVGDGPLRRALLDQRTALGLEATVEFAGQLPHDRLLELYRKGRVAAVVLPSIVARDGDREGIPVALMEAMAHGIPVITTRTGGNAELVEEAGLLVPPEDASALAAAIRTLLADPARAAHLAAAARRRVEERFGGDAIARELERHWRDALS